MPLSTGFTGRGITFEISDGASPPNWIKIANVTSINLSGREAEEIDFTTLDTEGGYRDFKQGFKDGGTVSLEYHFTPQEASHQEILSRFNSGEEFDWRINYTDRVPFYEVGYGFVQNPGDINITIGDPVGGTATVRVKGGTEIEPA